MIPAFGTVAQKITEWSVMFWATIPRKISGQFNAAITIEKTKETQVDMCKVDVVRRRKDSMKCCRAVGG